VSFSSRKLQMLMGPNRAKVKKRDTGPKDMIKLNKMNLMTKKLQPLESHLAAAAGAALTQPSPGGKALMGSRSADAFQATATANNTVNNLNTGRSVGSNQSSTASSRSHPKNPNNVNFQQSPEKSKKVGADSKRSDGSAEADEKELAELDELMDNDDDENEDGGDGNANERGSNLGDAG
jgi:hypothetical protein